MYYVRKHQNLVALLNYYNGETKLLDLIESEAVKKEFPELEKMATVFVDDVKSVKEKP
jgi:protoporphyrinogen oxidase